MMQQSGVTVTKEVSLDHTRYTLRPISFSLYGVSAFMPWFGDENMLLLRQGKVFLYL